jgi:hypothetical protein
MHGETLDSRGATETEMKEKKARLEGATTA